MNITTFNKQHNIKQIVIKPCKNYTNYGILEYNECMRIRELDVIYMFY